ncbi:hypothetical protein LSUE1_G003333 [Lachnellula suecica]|uniref:Uncharacterized protein n=1 Tax=Lachnellula suecica TaxID=602035 RepID=A0A8T9CIQ3_9HELO|nr:hypothetical protein LSUE1_G003333 [Lachnellula suecica]
MATPSAEGRDWDKEEIQQRSFEGGVDALKQETHASNFSEDRWRSFSSSYTHDPLDGNNDGLAYYKRDEFKTLFKDTEILAKGVEYDDDAWKAGMRRYGTSKLLMVMFLYELQRRLSSDPALSAIAVLALDPGGMAGTGIARDAPPLIRFLTGPFGVFLQEILVWFSPDGQLRPPRKSGADLLAACFDEEYLGKSPKGVYLNGSERAESSVESRNEGKQQGLWEDSLGLAGGEGWCYGVEGVAVKALLDSRERDRDM